MVNTRHGNVVNAPTAPADLLDRIEILEIKAVRIIDTIKKVNILCELNLLRSARDSSGIQWQLVEDLRQELTSVHSELWDAENIFRACERQQKFGPPFIAAGRAVIRGNARRADLKREINLRLQSILFEEKLYEN